MIQEVLLKRKTGGQTPSIIPKAANIPIWEIAQKELDSVQELRKVCTHFFLLKGLVENEMDSMAKSNCETRILQTVVSTQRKG